MSSRESDEKDPTRKQRREQARSERKAMEEAAAASASRRTRLTQLGAVVAVIVVAIVVILLATGGSSSNKAVEAKTPQATAISAEVNKLVAGIPQSSNTLGKPDAPVTLQYFGDLECPFCKQFTTGALHTLIEKWVRPGKLRIEYHSLETATREPETFRTQQVAALAAGKQGKMWNYVELFYHEQGEEDSGYVTSKFLQGLAQQVNGLNLSKWSSDRTDTTLDNQVEKDEQAASAAGFTGTPSFLIGKTGGGTEKLEASSFSDPSPYNAAIEKLLKS